MKKELVLTVLLGTLVLIQYIAIAHGGGPATVGRAFSTGAPGETTCASCHSGGSFGGDIFITEVIQDALANGYVKTQPHGLIVEVLSSDNFSVGGVQFVVLDTAGNQAGFVLPPNTSNSPIANRFNWYGKLYLEHDIPISRTNIGTTGRIFIGGTWIPSWNYDGPVFVYACAVLADGNSSVTGDNTFCTSVTLYPSRPLGIADSVFTNEPSPDDTWGIWQDHTGSYLVVHSKEEGWIYFDAVSAEGRIVDSGWFHYGYGLTRIKLHPSGSGAYFVKALFKKKLSTKAFFYDRK